MEKQTKTYGEGFLMGYMVATLEALNRDITKVLEEIANGERERTRLQKRTESH